MLFYLLDLVFLIAVQHVPPKVVFILLKGSAVIARVEVGRDQLLKVLQMHEFWVDLVQHLLVITLLQQVLVLSAQPKKGRVNQLQRGQSRKFHHSPVFAIGLEDLQGLAIHEEDIGEVETEGLGATQRKSIEDFLEPTRILLAVGVENVPVCFGLTGKAPSNTEHAVALVLSRQMAMRIDGFLEVAHDEGRNLLREWRGGRDGGALQELVTHTRWLLKLLIMDNLMKPIQLTVDQTAFRKSSAIAQRTTKSERMSRSHIQSSGKKMKEGRAENEEQLDIYFDKVKRRSYFRSVIDNYFVPHQNQALLHDSEPNIVLGPPMLSRECMSSQSSRVKPKASISISRLKLKSKLSLLDFSMPEMSSLPVIEEGVNGQKRPSSVHQPSSFISIERSCLPEKEKDKDMDESLYYDSSKSLMENSQVEIPQSFKLIPIHKGGKRLGKTKVYSSNEHKQLKRESSAKKLGMHVLWTPSQAQNSIQFPNYKTLREMCYSIVEDKNGEEPIFLIYPSAYYSSLFANQCEELIDIVVSLVKGVAKGRGMVANNQIHIKNIMKHAEKDFVLTDWGCASIRQDFTVQGRTFNKQLGALCRDGNKWLVAPQYLAPELLKATQTGCYDHLWGQKGGVGSCDIWSIGCLIFELITLVPLDTPYYCIVKGRDRKRGLFGNKLKTAQKILSKQRGFRNYALRCVREEMRVRKEVKVSERLLELLPRMLQENVEFRVSATEILMKLA